MNVIDFSLSLDFSSYFTGSKEFIVSPFVRGYPVKKSIDDLCLKALDKDLLLQFYLKIIRLTVHAL